MLQDPSADDSETTRYSVAPSEPTSRSEQSKPNSQLDGERQKIRHRTWTFYSSLVCVALGYIFVAALFVGCIQPSGVIAAKLDGHSLLIMLGVLLLIPTAILLTLIKERPGHEVESPLLIIGKELVEVLKTWVGLKGK